MLGASFDTPADNKAFAEAQQFTFRLLSDEVHRVGERYQVLRPSDDQYADLPLRVAYLIDPAGTIRRAYEVSDVAAFADTVLRDLADLQAG